MIQQVCKKQNSRIRVVSHRTALQVKLEQVALTRPAAHAFTMPVTVLQRRRRKVDGLGKLRLQRILLSQTGVTANLSKRRHHTLAHRRMLAQLTHRIRVTLESLAYQHALKHLLTYRTHRVAVKHLGILHVVYHSAAAQVVNRLSHRRAVPVEITQTVITVYHADNTAERTVIHRLAKLHRLLSTALTLHLLSVELSKCLCRVRHVAIGHKQHPRMLHAGHLLGSKPILTAVLHQVLYIRSVCALLSRYLTGYRAAVSAQHHSVTAHYRYRVYRTAIVVVGHRPGNILSALVTLIVAVVHRVAVLILREALILGKAFRGIVARRCGSTLHKHITAAHLLAVGQRYLTLEALHLLRIFPLLLDGRMHRMSTTRLLLRSPGKLCSLTLSLSLHRSLQSGTVRCLARVALSTLALIHPVTYLSPHTKLRLSRRYLSISRSSLSIITVSVYAFKLNLLTRFLCLLQPRLSTIHAVTHKVPAYLLRQLLSDVTHTTLHTGRHHVRHLMGTLTPAHLSHRHRRQLRLNRFIAIRHRLITIRGLRLILCI